MSNSHEITWKDAKSVKDLCEKAGLRDYAANWCQDAVKTLSEDQLCSFAWAFILDKFLHQLPRLFPILQGTDAAIKAFLFLGKEYDAGGLPQEQCDEAVARIKALLAPRENTAVILNVATAAEAFARMEKPTRQGRFASQGVLAALLQQHAAYNEDYISPYTTIVGPSGIGKSFAVQQLAVRYGLYVAYSNLAPATSRGYPRPVTMGATPFPGTREAMTQGWMQYLERQLLIAECCKKVGITAPGLFRFLSSNDESILSARATFVTLTAAEPTVASVCKALYAVREVLGSLALNTVPPMQPDDTELPVIVCFDEARALLDGVDNQAFHSLRQAAKTLALNLQDKERTRQDVKDELEETRKTTFFMLLLDTTSKISNFTPPLHHDRSAKVANERIFHPLYQIDSLDIFAPRNLPDPSGHASTVRKLFSYGRPLWGAFLEAGRSWESLLQLAMDKMTGYGDRAVNDIAIMSYRMNFYISSATMAKDLVASLMRCLVAISPDRSDLITTQPSEPVLAFAAAKLLQDPTVRLSCIRSWVGGLHAGSINPGDIGEQIASIVLLFAFDSAAFGTSTGLHTPPRAVALGDFVAALLGEHVRNDLVRSYAGTTAGRLLQEGTVFFNHFVRATSIPTLAVLENAYRRGAALLLPARFPGMDMALPIRAVPGGPLALLLLQIKNRKGDSNTPGLRLSMAEDLNKALGHLDLSADLHAVVGLVMCLRTQGDAHFVSTAPGRMDENETATARRSTRSLAKEKEKTSLRGGLYRAMLGIAFGLGPEVYACLQAPLPMKRTRTGREVARRQGAGSVNAGREMEEISQLLGRLVESWPNAYAEADTEAMYAQRLLDPFFDMTEAAEVTSENEDDN